MQTSKPRFYILVMDRTDEHNDDRLGDDASLNEQDEEETSPVLVIPAHAPLLDVSVDDTSFSFAVDDFKIEDFPNSL